MIYSDACTQALLLSVWVRGSLCMCSKLPGHYACSYMLRLLAWLCKLSSNPRYGHIHLNTTLSSEVKANFPYMVANVLPHTIIPCFYYCY